MLSHLLADIINQTFMSVVGKGQEHKGTFQAFHVRFSIPLNYDVEEGYRHVSLVLYARANYVKVVTREDWDVIPLDDLDYNEETLETTIKKGKKYQKGVSEWKLLCDHDSCWRNAVNDFIFAYSDKLNCFGHLPCDKWYEIIDLMIDSKYDLKDVLKLNF